MKLNNKYYILRHGQTVWQVKKKEWTYPMKDSFKIALTKNGKNQIREATKKLKNKGIDLIFSSDFYRTKQTSAIVARKLGLGVKPDKRLRDINLGVYHGGKKEEFYKDFPLTTEKVLNKKPPRGESWSDCQKRMLNFLRESEKRYKDKTILIVSHGDPLWLLEAAVRKWPIAKVLKIKAGKRDAIKVGELRRL